MTKKIKMSELRQLVKETIDEEKKKDSINESKKKESKSNKDDLKSVIRKIVKEEKEKK